MSEIVIVGLLVIAGSVAAHEYGHALMGAILGWRSHGWKIVWRKGAVGYALEAPEGDTSDLWLIAAAGLLATFSLTVFGYVLAPASPAFAFLAVFNAILLVVNCLPIPGSDGWHIYRKVLS